MLVLAQDMMVEENRPESCNSFPDNQLACLELKLPKAFLTGCSRLSQKETLKGLGTGLNERPVDLHATCENTFISLLLKGEAGKSLFHKLSDRLQCTVASVVTLGVTSQLCRADVSTLRGLSRLDSADSQNEGTQDNVERQGESSQYRDDVTSHSKATPDGARVGPNTRRRSQRLSAAKSRADVTIGPGSMTSRRRKNDSAKAQGNMAEELRVGKKRKDQGPMKDLAGGPSNDDVISVSEESSARASPSQSPSACDNASEDKDGGNISVTAKTTKAEVTYEIRGSGRHKVKIRKFARSQDVARSCIICDKSMGGLSSLHRHVREHHVVDYKQYRRVEVSLGINNGRKDSSSSQGKASKLRCLTPAVAQKTLDGWRAEHKPNPKKKQKMNSSFTCGICSKVTHNAGNLKRHMRLKHPGQKVKGVFRGVKGEGSTTQQHVELFARNEKHVLTLASGPSMDAETDNGHLGRSLAKFTCALCHVQLKYKFSFLRHIAQHHFLDAAGYLSLLDITDPAEFSREVDRVERDTKERKRHRKQSRLTAGQADRALFSCPACGEILTEASTLIVHVKKSHSEDPGLPGLLLKADELCSAVVRKDITDAGSFVTECPYCQRQRVGRSILRHLNICHEWEADLGAVYARLDTHTQLRAKARESARKKHSARAAYDAGMTYPCQFCEAQFKHRASKCRHESFACKRNPKLRESFWCRVCGKRIDKTATAAIEAHRERCSGEQRYVCHLCGKICGTKNALSAHKRTTHDAPETLTRNVCPTCGKRFYRSTTLKLHMAKHSDQRDSQCELCGKQFKTAQAVRKHQNCVHYNNYRFRCQDCGHGVMKLAYLESHRCGRVRRPQDAKADPQDAKDDRPGLSPPLAGPPPQPHPQPESHPNAPSCPPSTAGQYSAAESGKMSDARECFDYVTAVSMAAPLPAPGTTPGVLKTPSQAYPTLASVLTSEVLALPTSGDVTTTVVSSATAGPGSPYACEAAGAVGVGMAGAVGDGGMYRNPQAFTMPPPGGHPAFSQYAMDPRGLPFPQTLPHLPLLPVVQQMAPPDMVVSMANDGAASTLYHPHQMAAPIYSMVEGLKEHTECDPNDPRSTSTPDNPFQPYPLTYYHHKL